MQCIEEAVMHRLLFILFNGNAKYKVQALKLSFYKYPKNKENHLKKLSSRYEGDHLLAITYVC
jgi:hypothetical protein